jgi:hypothetical protein
MRKLEMDLEVGQQFQISMGPVFKGRWYEVAGFEPGRYSGLPDRRVLIRRVGSTGRGSSEARGSVERWVLRTLARQATAHL